jgi:deazaflavin-dependent oxidoreductase (nitroreductase family)
MPDGQRFLRAPRIPIPAPPLAGHCRIAGHVGVTVHSHAVKLRIVRALQVHVFNPLMRRLFTLGVVPPGTALLETVGRRSGELRTTPVGDGRLGDVFWIVAEQGRSAGYVRNLEANPRVRVRSRHGRSLRWRAGTAHVLDDDDPRERQRLLSQGHLDRRLNAAAVRAMGVELLSIRIDLDPLDDEAL